MFFGKNKEANYIKSINNNGIFDNSYENAYPQTVIADTVRSFLNTASDKHRRVLIFGFDGARADSMAYLIPSTNKKVTGYNLRSRYSAVSQLKNEGGLYLSFAGGDKNRPNALQETSTAQGWASILTGKWGIVNGVVKHKPLSKNVPTILTEAAREEKSALFTAIWEDHFTITYKYEIARAKEEKLPLEFKHVRDEEELQSTMLAAVDNGTDIIFGINEFPDYNGHMHGFGSDNYRYVMGVTNADRYAYELLEYVKARPEYESEDWLFIITSDHGGHGRGHGTQKIEDRMTFIATNKKL